LSLERLVDWLMTNAPLRDGVAPVGDEPYECRGHTLRDRFEQ